MVWQQFHLFIHVAEHQILGGKHFLIFGTRNRKNVVVEENTFFMNSTTAIGPSCVTNPPKWIFHNLGKLLRPLKLVPASRERVVTEWEVQTTLEDCMSKTKVITTSTT